MGLKILVGVLLLFLLPFADYFLISIGLGILSFSLGLYAIEYSGNKWVIFLIIGFVSIVLDVALQTFLGSFLGVYLIGILIYFLLDSSIRLDNWLKRNVAYFFVLFVMYYLLGVLLSSSIFSFNRFVSFPGSVLIGSLGNSLSGLVWILIINFLDTVLFGSKSKSIRLS